MSTTVDNVVAQGPTAAWVDLAAEVVPLPDESSSDGEVVEQAEVEVEEQVEVEEHGEVEEQPEVEEQHEVEEQPEVEVEVGPSFIDVSNKEPTLFEAIEQLCNNLLFLVFSQACVGFNRLYLLFQSFTSVVDTFSQQHTRQPRSVPAWYLYPFFVFQSVMFLLSLAYNLLKHKVLSQRHWSLLTQLDHSSYSLQYRLHEEAFEIIIHQPYYSEFNLLKAEAYLVDGEEIDVLDRMNRLLGPNLDWHNMSYTPKQLGYIKLRLVRYDVLNNETTARTFEATEKLLPLASL